MGAVVASTSAAYAANSAERLRGEPQAGNPWAAMLGNVVSDPSFETGSPNAAWTEFSSNFGTPLCTELTCGLGGGTGPNSGDWWAWFGGIAAPEEGSVSQMVTIPPAPATLSFGLEMAACSGVAADFMEVTIGGVTVFEVFGDDASCTNIGYRTVNVDISAVAGQTALLEFRSVITGAPDVQNFFVDDVDINDGMGGGVELSITGSCPGAVSIIGMGATPNAGVGIISSASEGSDVLNGGPCAGSVSGLTNPSFFNIIPTNGNGDAQFDGNAPANICGRFLQLVDANGCVLSNVVAIP